MLCNDTWLHIKTGSWIWEHGTIPYNQLYSFVIGNKEWIDHEWLFQVIIYPLYKFTGVNGLIFMRFVIISAILSIFFIVAKRTGRLFFLSASTLVISVMASFCRWLIRPELFSLLFVVIFVYMLKTYKGKNSIFVLIPLQILWVNLHGYFIIGPIFILLFLITSIVQSNFKLPFEWNNPKINTQSLKKLLAVFFMSIVVLLLTPYFLKGALYPVNMMFSAIKDCLSGSYAFSSVGELSNIPIMHIISNRSFSLLSVTIMIFLVSLLLNLKKVDIFDIFIFISLLFVTILANRHIGMLALTLGLLTLFNLKSAEREKPFMKEAMKRFAGKFLIKIALIIFTLFLIYNLFSIVKGVSNIFNRRYIYNLNCDTKLFIFGKDEFTFNQPYGAAKFLKDNHVRSNIFNFFNHGANLIYALYPDCSVFIDGRTEVYGDTSLRTWDKIRAKPELIDRIKGNLNIDCIVLPCVGDFTGSFFKYLYNSKEWRLVFFDGKSSVFLAENQRFEAIIKKNEIDLDNFKVNPDPALIETAREERIYPGIFVTTANFFYEIGMYNKGLEIINIAQRIMDSNYNIQNLKAILLLKLNRPRESIEYFTKALKLQPENPDIYRNIGGFYLGVGKPDIAREYFETGLRIDPDNANLKESLESLVASTDKDASAP